MTYKIPDSSKSISQPNDSDFSGNVWYSRNMDFTERGYMRLSHRAVSMVNEGTEVSGQFLLPLSFFGSSDAYQVATAKKVMGANIGEAGWAFDSTVYSPTLPNAGYGSQGVAWEGKFYVTYDTGIAAGVQYTTNGGSDWTDTGISLVVGVPHCLCVFDSKPSTSDLKPLLAVSNGSTVSLYNTSYSSEATLNLGSKYLITDLTFSFNKVGVSTQATDEAVFFTWDGSANPNPSGCPVGSIRIVSSVAYRSSFAILTVRGNLKFYTGGGFQDLASLPFFYRNRLWGQQALGSCLEVDSDLIYINIGTALNLFDRTQQYMENLPGGILCYDPKVGIYSRYLPSQSMVSSITVTSGNVSTATNTLTLTGGTLPATGSQIKYVSDKNSPIGGLVAGTVYYLINLDGANFRLAETMEDADSLTAIDITSTGASTNKFLALDLVDYGVSYTTGIQGGIKIPSTHTLTHDHLIFGTQVQDVDSTNLYANLNVTMGGFRNIGVIVTPKLYSAQTEDLYQKILIKFLPLKESDWIEVKVRDREILGLPVSTTLGYNNCSWTSSTVMTTTRDISAAYDAISTTNPVELEADIIGGAGAGQLSRISSISLNAGTYTVTLADAIDGATPGRFCDILIGNWRTVGTATSDDVLPYKEFGVEMPSKWLKVKAISRGTDIAIEEISVPNAVQYPTK